VKGRRSSRVQLVALGTVIVGGCSDDVPLSRFVYPTQQACVTEWGEKNCSTSGAGASGVGSVGPRYGTWVNLPTGEKIWSGTPNTPSFHPQTGKHLGAGALSVSRAGAAGGSASRGGFGSIGRSFSSGG
jgi:hypothetical protein